MSRRSVSPTTDGEVTLARKLTELVTVAILAVQLAVLAGRITTSFAGPADLPWMLFAAFLGVLFTDFISGLVHWLCDTFGAEDTPVLGALLIGPFREHHRDPQAMTRRGLLQINHANGVGIVVVLGVLLWLTRPAPDAVGSVFGPTFLVAFALAVYLTNTIHQWAHRAHPPALARMLQHVGLAIGTRHHARHHVAGRGTYCITTGWLNPLLDGCRVFTGLEWAVAVLRAPRQPAGRRATTKAWRGPAPTRPRARSRSRWPR